MSVFGADPGQLMAKGGQMEEQADSFRTNKIELFATIDKMCESDYVSPEAKVIGQKIKSYDEYLTNVENLIRAYGNYCKISGIDVDRNQQTIIEGIKL